MDKLKEILQTRREEIFYLIFGVLTTLINYIVFLVLTVILGDAPFTVMIINIIAWVAAVAFAYITNKLYVFESKSWDLNILKHEIPAFLGARVASFLLEEAGLYIATYWLHMENVVIFGIGGLLIAKIALNVLVVIVNYFFSKFLIFKKK